MLDEINPQELFNSQTFTERKQLINDLLNCKEIAHKSFPKCWVKYFELVMNAHHRSHYDTQFHSVKAGNHGRYHNNIVCSYTKPGEERTTDLVGVSSALSKSKDKSAKVANIKRALRNEIRDDVAAIKDYFMQTSPLCNLCGCSVTSHNAHLDHCGESEFRHIAGVFLKGKDINLIELTELPYGAYKFTDVSLSNEWKKLHNSKAKFQLLCQGCNLGKSKL